MAYFLGRRKEGGAGRVGVGDAGMKRTVDLICNDWILEVEGSKQEGVLQLDPIIAEAQLLREAIVQM